MGLLDLAIEVVRREANQNVDLVDHPRATKSTFLQHTDIKTDNTFMTAIGVKHEASEPNTVSAQHSNECETKDKNVDFVACAHEVYRSALNNNLHKNCHKSLSFYSIPRARKLQGQQNPGDCESCPAAGYYDGKGTDLWCAHDAYFLGKTKKPIQCSIASMNCPLMR